eukprot:7126691-Prymnesium_polylepis.2
MLCVGRAWWSRLRASVLGEAEGGAFERRGGYAATPHSAVPSCRRQAGRRSLMSRAGSSAARRTVRRATRACAPAPAPAAHRSSPPVVVSRRRASLKQRRPTAASNATSAHEVGLPQEGGPGSTHLLPQRCIRQHPSAAVRVDALIATEQRRSGVTAAIAAGAHALEELRKAQLAGAHALEARGVRLRRAAVVWHHPSGTH